MGKTCEDFAKNVKALEQMNTCSIFLIITER